MKPFVYNSATGLATGLPNGQALDLAAAPVVEGGPSSESPGALIWSTSELAVMVTVGSIWTRVSTDTKLLPFTTGSPEGVVVASPGVFVTSSNGSAWVKASGVGNTGWVSVFSSITLGKILTYNLDNTTGGL